MPQALERRNCNPMVSFTISVKRVTQLVTHNARYFHVTSYDEKRTLTNRLLATCGPALNAIKPVCICLCDSTYSNFTKIVKVATKSFPSRLFYECLKPFKCYDLRRFLRSLEASFFYGATVAFSGASDVSFDPQTTHARNSANVRRIRQLDRLLVQGPFGKPRQLVSHPVAQSCSVQPSESLGAMSRQCPSASQ